MLVGMVGLLGYRMCPSLISQPPSLRACMHMCLLGRVVGADQFAVRVAPPRDTGPRAGLAGGGRPRPGGGAASRGRGGRGEPPVGVAQLPMSAWGVGTLGRREGGGLRGGVDNNSASVANPERTYKMQDDG